MQWYTKYNHTEYALATDFYNNTWTKPNTDTKNDIKTLL